MSQQEHSEKNLVSMPEPVLQLEVENSTLDGGMQAAIGDDNIQIQGDSNVVTFNKTQILQISVDEIKTRKFIETSPYKGLKKFDPEDKDLFFGRDQFLTGLVNELEQTNLVLLLGASGSGKSSVVRAGLVPWLFQKYGTQLVNLTFTPDVDPFESLYANLLSKNTQSQAKIAREAKADTLTQVVTRLKQADDYWFILIDQFEELFTTSQPEKRERFIASLVQLAKAKLPKVKIMATMRADFLDKLSPYPALVKTTDKHRPLIAEMQLDELRLAIEQPAAHHGVVFETGLVEEIIKDVQGQAGYLPLLQYTLNLLWDTEVKNGSINDRTLNISTYRQLGGVRGALQQRVDNIYKGLSAQEKIATQRIFLKLVDIGGDEDSGTEWKPVRRRAMRSEFSSELEKGVLVKLINENLLVSDSPAETLRNRKVQSQQSTVEIAHETLLTSWEKLNTWIKENRQAIALRNRLNDDVSRWKASKAEDEQWGGSKLEKVLELRNDTTFNQVLGGFSLEANQFINASLGLRDRRRRRTIISLVSFSIFALMLTSVAGWQWQNSEARRRQAEIEAQILNSQKLFNASLDIESLIESLKVGNKLLKQTSYVNTATRMRAIVSLMQIVYGVREVNRFETIIGSLIAISPDSKIAAWSNKNNKEVILKSLDSKLSKTLKAENIMRASFSPNGKIIALEHGGKSDEQGTTLWSLDGQKLKTIKGYLSISFSQDCKTAALVANSNTVKLLSVDEQLTIRELRVILGQKSIRSMSLSPNGKKFIVVSDDNKAKLWSIEGEELQTLPVKGVKNISFRDNSTIAVVTNEGKAELWTVDDNKQIQSFSIGKFEETVGTPKISPDGQTIATYHRDEGVKLFNINTQELKTISIYKNIEIYNMYFNTNGTEIAIVAPGRVTFWRVSGQRLNKLVGHINPNQIILNNDSNYRIRFSDPEGLIKDIFSVDLSSDGKRLASGHRDGLVRLWSIFGKELTALRAASQNYPVVNFNPSSNILAFIGSDDSSIIVWDIKTNKHIIFRTQTLINSLHFSQDGKYLAIGGEDGTIKIFNWQTRELKYPIISNRFSTGEANPVKSIRFSPDGKVIAFSTYNDTKVWLVNLQSQKYKILKGQKNTRRNKGFTGFNPFRSIRISPDGKYVIPEPADLDLVKSIRFSPNGKILAFTNGDIVELWSIDGRYLKSLKGHSQPVTDISFSPDGKIIASSSEDYTVKLWDIDGQEIDTLSVHKAIVHSISFSSDGKTLASASRDQSIILWDLDLKNLLERGCSWLHNYLNTNPTVSESDKHLCNNINSVS